jgi:hypothetical protein
MSSQMVVYSIPLAQMRALLGSGRRDVLARIDYFPDLAEIFEEHFAFEDEEPMTPQEAVGHLLDGGPYRDGAEALYLFCFEALCRVLGQGRYGFQGIRWGYVEAVDGYLESIGFPLRVADLAAGGLPFDFPYSDSGPSIGHWPREKVAAARKCLTKDKRDSGVADLDAALVTVDGWLDVLAKRRGDILVGIYEC